MRRARFSIASLLAVIGILGVALAALRNPSYLWANATFSVAFGSLAVAVLNAIYGQGEGRAYWLGFAICGGAYFAVCSMPGLRESVCPRLVTEVVLDHLYPLVSPPVAANPTIALPGGLLPAQPMIMGSGVMGQMQALMQTQIRLQQATTWAGGTGRPAGTILAIEPAATESSSLQGRWASWNEPDRTNGVGYQLGTVSLVSSEAFRNIGHSLTTLLVAVLGGLFARRRYQAAAARALNQPQPAV